MKYCSYLKIKKYPPQLLFSGHDLQKKTENCPFSKCCTFFREMKKRNLLWKLNWGDPFFVEDQCQRELDNHITYGSVNINQSCVLCGVIELSVKHYCLADGLSASFMMRTGFY